MATLDEHARAGVLALNERRFDDAIEQLHQALAIESDRPDLNNLIGLAYLQRGEGETAVAHLERAVELARSYDAPEVQDLRVQFQLGLAKGYELLDRIGDAKRTLQDAIERWPWQVTPRLQLGQLLLASCDLEEGLAVYRALGTHDRLDEEGQKASQGLVDAIVAFRESEHPANVFLKAAAESYKAYFDEIAAEVEPNGWYTEAARMARGEDGEPRPIVAEGARSYAMQRVDLVNPADGTISSVYTEQEPMIVALNGFEPLSQLAVTVPWDVQRFPVWVSSRCAWHWLSIVVQFESGDLEGALAAVDPVIGDWYLAGFNGDFGEKEWGRFHFVTDPMPVGDRAVSYTVDLGRARFEAIEALLNRLSVLHDRRPIRRVLFGEGHLPD